MLLLCVTDLPELLHSHNTFSNKALASLDSDLHVTVGLLCSKLNVLTLLTSASGTKSDP